MDYEWDEAKRLANVAKHGIDFPDAVHIFEGEFVEAEDRRRNYGEVRMLASGELDGRVIRVVYTWRGDRRRIISAWRARRNDSRAYYASIEQAGEEDEKPD
jgi:uncharacterized DUF497 family protein